MDCKVVMFNYREKNVSTGSFGNARISAGNRQGRTLCLPVKTAFSRVSGSLGPDRSGRSSCPLAPDAELPPPTTLHCTSVYTPLMLGVHDLSGQLIPALDRVIVYHDELDSRLPATSLHRFGGHLSCR